MANYCWQSLRGDADKAGGHFCGRTGLVCVVLLAPGLSKITICEMEKREKIERGLDQALMVVLEVVFLARWQQMLSHQAKLPPSCGCGCCCSSCSRAGCAGCAGSHSELLLAAIVSNSYCSRAISLTAGNLSCAPAASFITS